MNIKIGATIGPYVCVQFSRVNKLYPGTPWNAEEGATTKIVMVKSDLWNEMIDQLRSLGDPDSDGYTRVKLSIERVKA